MILDEPTNDLDTDMLAAMEDLLDSWPGTLIVVRPVVDIADTVVNRLSTSGTGRRCEMGSASSARPITTYEKNPNDSSWNGFRDSRKARILRNRFINVLSLASPGGGVKLNYSRDPCRAERLAGLMAVPHNGRAWFFRC